MQTALGWFGAISRGCSIVAGCKRSNTPLWMPQSLWFAGMALFAVGTVRMAVHSLALLMRDRALLNRTYGPQSLEEEISTEISHLGAAEAVEGRRP